MFNTVLPNANMGYILSVEHQGYPSTAGWIRALWDGFKDHKDLEYNPPQYYINVADDARLHIIALTAPDVVSERIFGFAGTFHWNQILEMMRRAVPEGVTVPEDIDDDRRDLSEIVPRARAEELLKVYCGRKGWVGLEESVREHCTSLTIVR